MIDFKIKLFRSLPASPKSNKALIVSQITDTFRFNSLADARKGLAKLYPGWSVSEVFRTKPPYK